MGCGDSGDEELAAICVWACIRHGQQPWSRVAVLKGFIAEPSTIDGLATRAIHLGEIPALDHKTLDDSMEENTFVVERLPSCLPNAPLACAEAPKVFRCLRQSFVQAEHKPSNAFTSYGDIKEHTRSI